VIRRFEIERVYDSEAGQVEHVRFERIPDDQVGINELLRVAQVEVDAGGTYKPVNFRFFLRIAASFGLAALTEGNGRACKEQVRSARFAIRTERAGSADRFDARSQLTRDRQFQVDFARDTLLTIVPPERHGTAIKLGK
jgi:hypothetical protein